jgi:hypothetical protein
MLNKYLFIILFLFFNINLFAHRMPNIEISLENINNGLVQINVKNPNKQLIFSNQVKIISYNNNVLDEFILLEEKNSFKIPDFPYLVLIKINESLVYKKGIEPLSGFNTNEINFFMRENFIFRFFYFLSIVFFLFFLYILKKKIF